jgi:predicted nucleotidyltransferase
MIDNFLMSKLVEIRQACKVNNVVNLYAFGSIVDGRYKKGESDIDLMVEFDSKKFSKKENSKHLLKLWMELQLILGAKVDLITNENIKGDYFKKYLELYKENIYRLNAS